MEIRNSLNEYISSVNVQRKTADNYVDKAPITRNREVIQNYLETSADYRMNILRTVEAFRSFSDNALRNSAHCMEEEMYRDGDVIFHQEEIGDSFYIIEYGEVAIQKKVNVSDENEIPKELVRLHADAHFGQIALITEEPRSATIVVTSKYAKLLKMSKDTYGKLQAQNKALQEIGNDKIAMQVLDSISFIKAQPQSVRFQVMKAMNSVNFTSNNYICRQGSVGNTFYVITEGMCKVTILDGSDGSEIEVAKMYAGDFFGEIALLQPDAVRTANVVSVGFVTCLCLSREDFNTLLNTSKHLILEHSMNRQNSDRSGEKKQGYNENVPKKRRITCIDPNSKTKLPSLVSTMFTRLSKFTAESMFLSLYWKFFRQLVIGYGQVHKNDNRFGINNNSNSGISKEEDVNVEDEKENGPGNDIDNIQENEKEFIGKYGIIACTIYLKYQFNRFECVNKIRSKAIEILMIETSLRSEEEHEFIYQMMSCPNDFKKKFLQELGIPKYRLLCRYLLYAGSYKELSKVNEVGEINDSAIMLMKGSARTYTLTWPVHERSRSFKKAIFEVEEDVTSGEAVHMAALGGMHERLLGMITMTPCDILKIRENDYIDCRGDDSYTISAQEKYKYLQNVPLFKNWDRYHLYLIAQQLEHVDCAAGMKLLKTGEFTDHLSFLLHGSVQLLSNSNRKSVVSNVQKHEVFGESAALNYFFAYAGFHEDLEVCKMKGNLSNTFKQSKRDRKEIRSTNRNGHPDVYYEHTDAITGSHVELLVLRSEHFHLLNSTFASALRNIYYRRAQWRSNTSKALVFIEKKVKDVKQNFVSVAKKAAVEEDPDAYYRNQIPSEDDNNMIKLRDYNNGSSSKNKNNNEDNNNLNDGSLTSSIKEKLSHSSMHKSIQNLKLHITAQIEADIKANTPINNNNSLMEYSSLGDIGGNISMFPSINLAPSIIKSPDMLRPHTSDGRGGSRSRRSRHKEGTVRDIEDIPKMVQGTINPIALLGTTSNDKQRRQYKELIQSYSRTRAASEKYSRLPTSASHSRRSNLQSRGGSRPNTANMIMTSNKSNNNMLSMNSEVVGELDDTYVELFGTSPLRNKKVYSDCLTSKEILTFKPSSHLTKTKKPNYHF